MTYHERLTGTILDILAILVCIKNEIHFDPLCRSYTQYKSVFLGEPIRLKNY